jgi:hypothetical protein
LLGCGVKDLEGVLLALGFRRIAAAVGESPARWRAPYPPRASKRRQAATAGGLGTLGEALMAARKGPA